MESLEEMKARLKELELELEDKNPEDKPPESTEEMEKRLELLKRFHLTPEDKTPESIDSLRNKVKELEKNENQSTLNDEKQTKPLNLKIETYNKLLALKNGECTTFTKVVEKLIKDNKILENENIELLRFKLSILEREV